MSAVLTTGPPENCHNYFFIPFSDYWVLPAYFPPFLSFMSYSAVFFFYIFLVSVIFWRTFFISFLFFNTIVQPLSHVHSLWPCELQYARLPCPSSPWVCSNSRPLSQWCHPTISSSATPISSCPQSFPASGYFPMSHLFTSVASILEFSIISFQWIFRIDFL